MIETYVLLIPFDAELHYGPMWQELRRERHVSTIAHREVLIEEHPDGHLLVAVDERHGKHPSLDEVREYVRQRRPHWPLEFSAHSQHPQRDDVPRKYGCIDIDTGDDGGGREFVLGGVARSLIGSIYAVQKQDCGVTELIDALREVRRKGCQVAVFPPPRIVVVTEPGTFIWAKAAEVATARKTNADQGVLRLECEPFVLLVVSQTLEELPAVVEAAWDKDRGNSLLLVHNLEARAGQLGRLDGLRVKGFRHAAAQDPLLDTVGDVIQAMRTGSRAAVRDAWRRTREFLDNREAVDIVQGLSLMWMAVVSDLQWAVDQARQEGDDSAAWPTVRDFLGAPGRSMGELRRRADEGLARLAALLPWSQRHYAELPPSLRLHLERIEAQVENPTPASWSLTTDGATLVAELREWVTGLENGVDQWVIRGRRPHPPH